MDRRRAVGAAGEQAARNHVDALGWDIVGANVRLRGDGDFPGLPGELDLIANQAGTMVFLEVKTRCGLVGDVHPEVSVSVGKQRQIARLALAWLARTGALNAPDPPPVRFDVISVVLDPELRVRQLIHRRGAFNTDNLSDGWDD